MRIDMQQYIYRQTDPQIAALRYGKGRKCIAHNGCGLVAIYNVMQRLGRPQPFEAVVRDAQRLHMPWLFGLFGTKPSAPARYFRDKGVPFVRAGRHRDFCERLTTADTAIICTWCDKRRHGIHFYTVCNDNGTLTALNRFYADAPTPFSLEELRRDRFITGYLFDASAIEKS